MDQSFGKICSFLHVDDSADELYFVREVAGMTGLPFHIEPFLSGEGALAYIGREDPFQDTRAYPVPDFVLLDYDLKASTAPRVIQAMRKLQRGKSLPIVVYSNSGDRADILRSYQAGADHYLIKPARLARVRVILEILYACATSQPPDYGALARLEEHPLHLGDSPGATPGCDSRLKS
jgi:CheY-like chemotaxis protein